MTEKKQTKKQKQEQKQEQKQVQKQEQKQVQENPFKKLPPEKRLEIYKAWRSRMGKAVKSNDNKPIPLDETFPEDLVMFTLDKFKEVYPDKDLQRIFINIMRDLFNQLQDVVLKYNNVLRIISEAVQKFPQKQEGIVKEKKNN